MILIILAYFCSEIIRYYWEFFERNLTGNCNEESAYRSQNSRVNGNGEFVNMGSLVITTDLIPLWQLNSNPEMLTVT